MKTISIQATEHATPHDALVELNFSGDRAISIGGRHFTVDEAEFCRIENSGVQPTTWHHLESTGRIVSVPGRHA